MNKPLISIIVPVYNVESYLDCCIQSIVNQSYAKLEIILVDDGSTDSSGYIGDAWANIDSRICVIHNTNNGVCHARNTGINCATGDFLFFVDGDDCVNTKTLDACVAISGIDTQTIVIVNNDRIEANDFRLDNREQLITTRSYEKCAVKDYHAARPGWGLWGILVSRELVRRNHLYFDEQLNNLEDAAWLGVLLSFVKRIIYIPNDLYHYRKNPFSITAKCIDREWQAQGWVRARQTILRYFSDREVTSLTENHIRKMNRYCMNNFHAECFAGDIAYDRAATLFNPDGSTSALRWFMPVSMKLLNERLSYFEYSTYVWLFRLRKWARDKHSRLSANK